MSCNCSMVAGQKLAVKVNWETEPLLKVVPYQLGINAAALAISVVACAVTIAWAVRRQRWARYQ